MDAPVYDIDFYSDEVILDPWPHYARMRKLGPVIWLPRHKNYALTRHKEIRDALRNHELFISGKGVAGDQFGCDFLQGNTVASDEPKHSELRRAMAPPLLPGALSSISDKIQQAADELIEDLVQREHFDTISDLARHLPLTIVRELVGLPDFGQENMLKWAAAAFDVLGTQNERGKKALPAIEEMRTFIQREATRENLKEGSWTRRIHELVDEKALSCEHAPFAIRDYINPSLDTTISAMGELIKQLAINPDQWEALKMNAGLANKAVNEAIRLGSPARSFSRHTSNDVDIEGIKIPKGARVMMLFASANRDERVFADPDKFDLSRNSTDHLGFGSGIHMCVGMHLAQLEMEALIKAMIPRVGRITVGKSQIALNNTICAYSSLPTQFELEARHIEVPHDELKPSQSGDILIGKITERKMLATDIVGLVIEPTAGGSFPSAEAGAHIDIYIAPGLTRQYSLTGDITENQYRIAVQKEPASKGGSVAMHKMYAVGSSIRLGRPRNNFPLSKHDGKTLLFGGGIGLTPLLPMAWDLHKAGKDFEFYISVRSRSRLAFKSDYETLPFAQKIRLHIDEEVVDSKIGSPLDVNSLLDVQSGNQHIYVCGPTGFMEYVCREAEAARLPKNNIHLEHFGSEIDSDGDPFTVIAKRSNKTVAVPSNKTILQVLQEQNIEVQTSCQNGVCGSCLTQVLDGTPDHRDMIQTDTEKASNGKITVCCSRSKSKTLVLDI